MSERKREEMAIGVIGVKVAENSAIFILKKKRKRKRRKMKPSLQSVPAFCKPAFFIERQASCK